MKIIIMPDQPQEEYGIYGECVTTKGEPDILAKTQKSILDRFGFEDEENNTWPNSN